MAGDWIKMRGNLWDDPRVSAIVDATDSSEAAVVGGLYWLWAAADQHTEDGFMPGLSLRQIDRKTGIAGLGAAIVSVGWIVEEEGGIRIPRFAEHNGASAKKRCQTAKRVAKHKVSVVPVTLKPGVGNAESVSPALPRDRDRDREEIENKSGTDGGRACKLMREAGCVQTNPQNPDLLAAIAEGVTPEALAEYARIAIEDGKPRPFGYAIAHARGEHARGAKPVPGANHANSTQRSRVGLADRHPRPAFDGDAIPGEAVRIDR